MSDNSEERFRDLKQRFLEVLVNDVSAFRKIAMDCLEPRFYETHASDPDSEQGILSLGLYAVARNYHDALQESQPGVLGYSHLEDELNRLQSAFDTLADRLKSLTPQAAAWIQYPQISGDPNNERIRALSLIGDMGSEISTQSRGEKGPLVERCEALVELMGLLSTRAVKAKIEAPPGKQYIPDGFDSPAFRLFLGCGKELLLRRHDLRYLRPIAEAIYVWVYGINPSASWEIRAEKDARAILKRKFGRAVRQRKTKG